MPPKQIAGGAGQVSKTTTNGTVDRVTCPWCGKHNDFRPLKEQNLYDTGHEVFCDHCGYSMKIQAIRMVELVYVVRNPGKRAQPQTAAGRRQLVQQRQQLAQRSQGGFFKKLLGAPKK